jgi:hypothetical protein
MSSPSKTASFAQNDSQPPPPSYPRPPSSPSSMMDSTESKKRGHDDVEKPDAHSHSKRTKENEIRNHPDFEQEPHPPLPPPVHYAAPQRSNYGPSEPNFEDPDLDPARLVRVRCLVSTKDAGIVIGSKGAHVVELKEQMGKWICDNCRSYYSSITACS